MIKKRNLILLLGMSLTLTSCVMKQKDKNNFQNNINLIELSESYSHTLTDGSYKKNNFFSNFNEEAQKTIDKNNLYQSIEHINRITGPMKNIEKTQVTEQSVLLQIDNEKRKSSEIYSYDINGKLTNLSLFPGPIKKRNSKSYTVEPVELHSDNLIIPGALTIPKNIENPKIAIMITGLGPYDMDETIGLSGNQPFKNIALTLATNGIATLRYDKSILHGNSRNTIEDEYLNDFNTAYNFVENLPNIDKENIYIIAHDTGASLAPSMAKDKNIKGIVLMSGSLRHLSDLIFDQNETLVNQSNGLSEEDKKIQLENASSEVLKAKNINLESKEEPFGLKPSYWNSLNQLDLKKDILSFNGNLFIIHGENDFQSLPQRNYYEYIELLSGKDNVRFKLYEGLSHIFTPSDNNKYDMSVYDKKSYVSSEVTEDISNWINE